MPRRLPAPESAPGPDQRTTGRRSGNLEALTRRCEARLRTLPLPTPFDVEALSRSIGARRGRPIVLRPVRRLPRVAGFCFPDGANDVIVYASDTSLLHQEHIILHELCHLWCDHRLRALTTEEVAAVLGDDISMPAVQWFLPRASYSAADDREAEVLATLILERVEAARRMKGRAVRANDREALRRLAGILGDESVGRT